MNNKNYILKSNNIFTAVNNEVISGAVAVKGNKITAVGKMEEVIKLCDANTKIIDFGDRLIMPGFNDAHMHFSLGSIQNDPNFCLFLVDCKSEEECVERVAKFAKENPDNEWIYGWGWYSAVWDNPHTPSRKTLDALNLDRPICLSSFDLHSAWCNGAALEKAGITRNTPQPVGASIGIDENGELTGILEELAATSPVTDMVLNVPTLKSSLLKCLANFRRLGITAIADVYPSGLTNKNILDIIHEIETENNLTSRVSLFPDLKEIDNAKKLKELYNSKKLRVAGLKLIIDGVVESHTAYLSEPYKDAPTCCGKPSLTQEELNNYVLAAEREGFAVKLHGIGDKAITMALDAYENAQKVAGVHKLHHSVEHIETVKAKDIARMAGLNVLACVQPQHVSGAIGSGAYNVYLGDERVAAAWPFREVLDSGAKLVFRTFRQYIH